MSQIDDDIDIVVRAGRRRVVAKALRPRYPLAGLGELLDVTDAILLALDEHDSEQADARAQGWAAAVAALRDAAVTILVEEHRDPKDPFAKFKRFLAPHDRETAALHLEALAAAGQVG